MGKKSISLINFSELPFRKGQADKYVRLLIENIKGAFSGKECHFEQIQTGLLFETNCEAKDIHARLSKIFGISNFMECEKISLDINEIKKIALSIATSCNYKTFCIRTKRFDKKFPLNSKQTDIEIGSHVYEKIGIPVDLKNGELTIYINIFSEFSLIGFKKFFGVKGVPAGFAERAIILLSGGFCSAVSANRIMKRGIKPIFLHFHSDPYRSNCSLVHVKKVIDKLCLFQPSFDFYSAGIGNIQKEIAERFSPEMRKFIYKALIIKVADKLLQKTDAEVIVTGDMLSDFNKTSIARFFSACSYNDLPVIRPIIGMSKEEIVNEARRIDVFDDVNEEYDDFLNFMESKEKSSQNTSFLKQKIEYIANEYTDGAFGLMVKEC